MLNWLSRWWRSFVERNDDLDFLEVLEGMRRDIKRKLADPETELEERIALREDLTKVCVTIARLQRQYNLGSDPVEL